jgi:hypothetical protein
VGAGRDLFDGARARMNTLTAMTARLWSAANARRSDPRKDLCIKELTFFSTVNVRERTVHGVAPRLSSWLNSATFGGF